MILPMKKVSLVVMEKSREETLVKLRELGLVHLVRKNVSSDALSKLLDRKTKIENAQGILRPYGDAKKAPPETAGDPDSQEPLRRRAGDLVRPEDALYSADAVEDFRRPDLAALILEYAEERKSLQDRAAALTKERSRIEDWGNFQGGDFAFLEERGIKFIPYKIPSKAFGSLPQDIRFIKLGQDKNSVYLLALDREIPGETPFVLPEHSLGEIDGQAGRIREQLADIERRFFSLADRMRTLENEGKSLLSQIEFETARLGMDSSEGASPGLAWITGFIPQEDLGHLKRAAAENAWALAAGDPASDDPVPTKLKNNKLVSLIYPLTDFLEVTPGYREADISGWFLMFFVVFFGMIFGDAGYGALIALAGLIGILKTAKKGVPPILKLLLLLGLSNFTWGMLTCSWFGVKAALLPEVLRNISLPLISNVTADRSAVDKALVQQNLMIFCFSLALLQLSIGHILAIIHDKSMKILGHIGSIAMLGGMYFIILSLIASNEARQIPMYPIAVYVFAGGFALNFVFANYEGSIGRSILESLKNIISVILGIANIFSDIMSYIRLWAVGLAGAAIADTVDTMALQIGGLAGPVAVHFIVFILAGLLLIFGHGLNLVLNVLSVLVHGVRLNTLEFSGHVGLTWAGIPYKPFAKHAIRSRG
jgi:V/A-type H+-transporting ATPase subunit I